MADIAHETWITGVGVVSCLGEGPQAHWQALRAPPPPANLTTWPPFAVHPLVALDIDKQVPKKGDQRQMEAWQRIGTYAAGLALESAGIKGNAETLAHTGMILSASGGERDTTVDTQILSELRASERPAVLLNERLMNALRPTLFLSQRSNLLAGNISIVHGVVGSSRTFMGEESAGVDAVRVAQARIAAGQSELTLVGGAYHGTRWDVLLAFELGGVVLKDKFAPVWDRGPGGGIAFATIGAFLVLESKEHATARGARPRARISQVLSDGNGKPSPRSSTARIARSFPARPGSNRPHRLNLRCSRKSDCRSAIPAHISGMASIPSSWLIWELAAP